MNLSKKGMSVIEVLIATGIVSVGAVFFMNGVDTFRISKGKIDSFRGVENFQTQILGQLNSAPAWSQTINQITNTSLSCLRSGSDCFGQGGTFVVYDQEGKVFFDPMQDGINENGEKCQNKGSALCPYQVSVNWTPVCSGPSCYNPAVRFESKIVQANMSVQRKTQGAVLDSKFIQSFGGNSLQSACLAIRGTYDSLTGECALSLDGDCPSTPVQQVVVGVTSTMQKICKPLYFNAICDNDSYFAGIKVDGSPWCLLKDCCVANFCIGTSQYQREANCTGTLIATNSPACGYVTPPPVASPSPGASPPWVAPAAPSGGAPAAAVVAPVAAVPSAAAPAPRYLYNRFSVAPGSDLAPAANDGSDNGMSDGGCGGSGAGGGSGCGAQ